VGEDEARLNPSWLLGEVDMSWVLFTVPGVIKLLYSWERHKACQIP